MRMILGKCTEIVDPLRFVIRFTSKGLIEDKCIAYPIDTFDEPELDCEVVLFELETKYGYSWLWKKMRLFNHTREKILGTVLDMYEDKMELHTGDGAEVIQLDSKSKTITYDAQMQKTCPGVVTPDPRGGPWCAVPVCPLTGLPHQGHMLTRSGGPISSPIKYSNPCDCLPAPMVE